MECRKSFKEAIVEGCNAGAVLWTDNEGTIFDIDSMVEFGEIADKVNRGSEDHPFSISLEGAIGLCSGKEYDTDWLFYPVEDRETILKYKECFKESL